MKFVGQIQKIKERLLKLRSKSTLKKSVGVTLGLSMIISGSACLPGDTRIVQTENKEFVSDLTLQNERARTLNGAHFSFHFSDFYTLTEPNPNTGCAGDLKNYYNPFDFVDPTARAPQPVRFEENFLDSSTTIRPAFIKNVSVNLTDASAPVVANLAQDCSFGTGASSPPVSSCSTFDFGAIAGIPTSMGGTLLMIGGLVGPNYSGFGLSCGPTDLVDETRTNFCSNQVFALGLNTLPPTSAGTQFARNLSSSETTISTWSDFTPKSGDVAPRGIAGAAASLNQDLGQVLLFGGVSPIEGNVEGFGGNTVETWIFDIQNRTWRLSDTKASISLDIQRQRDFTPGGNDVRDFEDDIISQYIKNPGGRAVFGYISIPLAGITKLESGISTSRTAITVNYAEMDTTDRIFTIGGLGNCQIGACTDTHRFNPTFGPEYYSLIGDQRSPGTDRENFISQWIDSSPDTLVSNGALKTSTNVSDLDTQYIPRRFPQPSPTPSPSMEPINTPFYPSINFGASVAVQKANVDIGSDSFVEKTIGMGYPVLGGGFLFASGAFGNWNTSTTGGDLQIGRVIFAEQATDANDIADNQARFFTMPSNAVEDLIGGRRNPIKYYPIDDANRFPWLGGGEIVRWNRGAHFNGFVFFGGSRCRSYLVSGTICGTVPMAIGYTYFNLGDDPTGPSTVNSSTRPALSAANFEPITSGIFPKNAGMAVARGTDLAGNPIVVAWGGMQAPGAVSTEESIYYLYKEGNPSILWGKFNYASGSGPSPRGNSSMVFSHATRKFYLFAGYEPSTGNFGDTWELSVDPLTPACGNSTTPTCQFIWRNLNPDAGMTCYPRCPEARRSHRMVETNYNNIAPGFEPNCTSAGTPCSFGIFMQGGTPDGVSYFTDRWMFDPTANDQQGHWQRVNSFPPRSKAMMASVNYEVIGENKIARRALLFGGETGMASPSVSPAGFMIPPTLGDTWLFDFDTQSWNRVKLYGGAVDDSIGTVTGGRDESLLAYKDLSETQARSLNDQGDALALKEYLTPPPTAGGMMLPRTLRKVAHTITEAPKAIKIPEIYMVGGRNKIGRFHPIDEMWKFCVGTTGEAPAGSNGAVPGSNPTYGYSSFYKKVLDAKITDNPSITNPVIPNDGSCDGFDPDTNPRSFSPTAGYVGRWMRKSPLYYHDGPTDVTPDIAPGSYLGAITYDTTRDLILLWGGLTNGTGAIASTSLYSPEVTTLGSDGSVFELTPQAKTYSSASGNTKFEEENGYWTRILRCKDSPIPTGRYGHSMGYDPNSKSIFVVGGYDANDVPLNQFYEKSDETVGPERIPEVWSATRIERILTNGLPEQGIPRIIEGDVGTGAFPCYYWQKTTKFGNLVSDSENPPPFDTEIDHGLAMASTIFVPSSGYNTGYYTMIDNACIGAGPIISTDSSINKQLVGGVYFDINRNELAPDENLILTLTFIPLGPDNQSPTQEFFSESEAALFKVHLIRTGQSGDLIRQTFQPRDFSYSANDIYPKIADSISIIAPPTGQMVQEQVIIPLAFDPSIDRIRVERQSGSGILIDATLMRTSFKESTTTSQ